jgi:hypothetical protein
MGVIRISHLGIAKLYLSDGYSQLGSREEKRRKRAAKSWVDCGEERQRRGA